MITLKKIDLENIWKVVGLSVKDRQESFVASNTESILEAYAAVSDGKIALPFAIYSDGLLVGFVMFGYGSTADADDPNVAIGNYSICRFMIDQKYQGHGYGKAALNEALNYLRTQPCGPSDYCWLSYEPDNRVAKDLYMSVGFEENGEMDGEEIVAVIRLR